MIMDSIHSHFFKFSISNFVFDKNVFIIGVDNSSSTNADNRKEDILVLGEWPTQGLDDTTIEKAETKYSINFTESKKCLF